MHTNRSRWYMYSDFPWTTCMVIQLGIYTLAKIGFANNYYKDLMSIKKNRHYHHCNYPIGISFSTSHLQVGCLSNILPLNFHGHFLATCQLSCIRYCSHDDHAYELISHAKAFAEWVQLPHLTRVYTRYAWWHHYGSPERHPISTFHFPLSIFHGALIRTFTKS